MDMGVGNFQPYNSNTNTFAGYHGFNGLANLFSKNKKAGRREYLRGRLTPEGQVAAFHSEGSGIISGLSWANGLIELEDEARKITPGDPVRFYPYAAFGL